MRVASLLSLSTLCLLACSTSTPSKTTSVVEGRVAANTFALGAPTGIDAIDETGARTHVKLGADGSFRFEIPKAHVYRLVSLTPKGEEPVVFPRVGGRLDRSFRVSSGGARISLGTVNHLDRAPTTGFTSINAAKTSCEGGGEGADDNNADDNNDGECDNGKDAKTGAACSDGDNATDDADPAEPMDVPDTNPPNDVAGCEGDESEGEDTSD